MKKADAFNKRKLKSLQKAAANKSMGKADFTSRLRNTKSKLAPRQPAGKESKNNENYEKLLKNLQNDYNKKIDALRNENDSDRKKNNEESGDRLGELTKKLDDSNAKFNELSSYLGKKEQAEAQARQAAAEEGELENPGGQEAAENPGSQGLVKSLLDKSINAANELNKAKPTVTEEKTTTTTTDKPFITITEDKNIHINTDGTVRDKTESEKQAASRKGFAKLGLQQRLNINDKYYTIVTNLFGDRSGANSVVGRKGHSKGVDVVTFTRDGKASNVPMSFTSGTIVNVALMGSGKPIGTLEGSANGYFIDVRTGNKIIRYSHLSKEAYDQAQLNTTVTRGEPLFKSEPINGSYAWSGSGTNPQVKVSVFDIGKDGQTTGLPSDPSNNPSNFIFYGAQA